MTTGALNDNDDAAELNMKCKKWSVKCIRNLYNITDFHGAKQTEHRPHGKVCRRRRSYLSEFVSALLIYMYVCICKYVCLSQMHEMTLSNHNY